MEYLAHGIRHNGPENTTGVIFIFGHALLDFQGILDIQSAAYQLMHVKMQPGLP